VFAAFVAVLALSATVITSLLVSGSMMPWAPAALRSWVEPGSAGEAHPSRPAASAAVRVFLAAYGVIREPDRTRRERTSVSGP
jgi:hypothetical protein